MTDNLQQLKSAIEKALDDPSLYVKRALLFFKKREYQKCIEDCERAIALEKNNAIAFGYMGYSYFYLKEYKKALDASEKALSIDANHPLAYVVRGNIYVKQQKNYDKALEVYDKAIKLDSAFAIAYNSRGSLYYRHFNDLNKAMADYEKAIELDSAFVQAYNNRGIIYADLNDYDKALMNYNKAIQMDATYPDAYNNRGNLYVGLRDYDKALSDYNRALELDSDNVVVYNNLGNLYASRLKDYDKALAYFNKAIQLDANYSAAYNSRGLFYAAQLNDKDKALADYHKAIELESANAIAYKNRGDLYARQLKAYDKALVDYGMAKLLFSNKNNFMVRLIEGDIQEINGLLSKSNAANQRIKLVMEKINAAGIEDNIRQTKESFKKFISEKQVKPTVPAENDSEFVVLRRWNSYTPIIAENNRISKGGGYFFKLHNCGIVIDPGFNFIDNFKAQGYGFCEIDHVFITHAHNDHTTDLESILTLLHQYNETILGSFDAPDDGTIMQEVLIEQKEPVTENDRGRIEELAKIRFYKSGRRKRLRIYMTTSTYKKYAPILNLYKNSDYDIILIKAGDKLPILYPSSSSTTREHVKNLKITAIAAKHDDLLSNRDSLGFIIHYRKFILVYTGDTGFHSEIESQYKEIRKKYKDNGIVLLAHLGGFKECEKKYDTSKNTEENHQFFYKNHLGRLGLAKLVEVVQPKICIISEFGEEFRNDRIKLTRIFQEVYNETFFVPADIGLCLNSENEVKLIDKVDRVKNTVQYAFYPYSDTTVCERWLDASLHYYRKAALNEADLRELLTNQYHLQPR